MLTSMAANPTPAGIRLHWSFSGDADPADVRLDRAPTAAGPWQSLSGIERDGSAFACIDRDVAAGASYVYRLSWLMESGVRVESTLEARALDSGAELTLALAPNPASSLVRFHFVIPSRGAVDLDVLDLQGRRVARVVHGEMDAGAHVRTWRPSAMGRFYARLHFGDRTIVRELTATR
jgi:hypothetical protein